MKHFLKFLKYLIFTILLVLIIGMGIIVYQGYSMYKEALNAMSIDQKIEQIKSETETYTKYEEMPENYIDAVIAVEDRRFFEHNGIDLRSITRAIIKDIQTMSLVEGCSTITQQLAKNTYFTQKKEFTRKIAEIFMAFEFENKCSKEEIFELYANTMYFGDGYYCVEEAAEGYFDKKVSEMNLYESTLLAGIPNAPSVYAPTKNPELAQKRQTQII